MKPEIFRVLITRELLGIPGFYSSQPHISEKVMFPFCNSAMTNFVLPQAFMSIVRERLTSKFYLLENLLEKSQ